MSRRPIAGVLLAAGLSNRHGGDKLLKDYRAKNLMRYSAELLAGLDLGAHFAVVLSGASERTKISEDCGLIPVINTAPKRGMGHSTALGAKAILEAGFDSALILLADMPFVTTVHCRALIRRSVSSDWVFSKTEEFTGPPAVLSGAALHSLLKLDGDRGAKSIAPKDAIVTVDLQPHLARDMDRPEDFLT